MAGRIFYTVHHDATSRDRLTVEVREQDDNRCVGYVEITLTPTGALVVGTNGADDSDADGEIVLRAEAPA